MANNISIVGRLTREAEVKSGKKDFMVFALADDAARDNTIFHDCICFDERLTSAISKYLTKGKPIFVSGRLEDNSYEKDGVKVKRNQVVVSNISFISGDKKEGDSNGQSSAKASQAPKSRSESSFSGGFEDDEIPF